MKLYFCAIYPSICAAPCSIRPLFFLTVFGQLLTSFSAFLSIYFLDSFPPGGRLYVQ